MSINFVLIDTNIFLHYQPVEQINWAEVVGSDTVKLIVAPVVIQELDKHKDQHRLSAIRDRARTALKKVRSVVLGDPTLDFLEGVNLLSVDEPDIDFRDNGLNRDVPDDHLIASCLGRMDK